MPIAAIAQTEERAGLPGVKSVYLLPMASGMDQYLASQLIREGVLHVVTDPAKADAVITDRLGASFEASLKELYPEFRPGAHASGPKDENAAHGSDASKAAAAAGKDSSRPAEDQSGKEVGEGEAPGKATPGRDLKSVGAERPRPAVHARGMVFLVRRGTWDVVWSAYVEPSSGQSKDRDKAAAKIVSQMKASMKAVSGPAPESK